MSGNQQGRRAGTGPLSPDRFAPPGKFSAVAVDPCFPGGELPEFPLWCSVPSPSGARPSPSVAGGFLLAALELNRSDGPWERPDNYEKTNAVLRFSRGDARNGFSITASGYWADWDSTDQVPARAIADGRITRFGLVEPSDRGYSHRETLVSE